MAVKPKLPAASSNGAPPTTVDGIGGMKNDITEKSGFQTSGYIDKKGTPYGDTAMFNHLPPGMEMDDQAMADIRNMPMKTVVSESYPGDGWE